MLLLFNIRSNIYSLNIRSNIYSLNIRSNILLQATTIISHTAFCSIRLIILDLIIRTTLHAEKKSKALYFVITSSFVYCISFSSSLPNTLTPNFFPGERYNKSHTDLHHFAVVCR